MTVHGFSTARPRPRLRGRRRESAVLAELVDGVLAGRSGALVVRGEEGVGKTALLEHALERARGCRIAQVSGVESEMELPFAGLHQLCQPMLDRLDRLPAPQSEALAAAFGFSGRGAPDRFLVGLAALGLLSEVAEEQPLVCIIDDAHWLDRASAQALAFAARRLGAEAVAMVFAVREPRRELAGLPELVLEGLRDGDARALLLSVVNGRLDERVSERIVAETRGNPLALLELPRGLTRAELAAGFGHPASAPVIGRIEESFLRRLEPLPDASRQLLLVAAAEPLGDPLLLWRAAERLGLDVDAAAPLEAAGLLRLGAHVRFRHPLVRSAVYRAATPEQRREAHRTLAEVTDPEREPDRMAWHHAQAAAGLDEDVAAELERSAGRARDRGGVAAAAAFLTQAAGLTADPRRRSVRALAAARADLEGGAPDEALNLLSTAEAGPLDELQRARADRLRAEIAFSQRRGSDAPALLLKAARRLEPLDVVAARETYLETIEAAIYAGRLGDHAREVARAAARAQPAPPGPERASDLLLEGYVALHTEGLAVAVPTLKRALHELRHERDVRWLVFGCRTAAELFDDESWYALGWRQHRLAVDAGALSMLPLALNFLSVAECVHAGNLAAATALIEEMQSITPSTGSPDMAYGPLAVAAWRGHPEETAALLESAVQEANVRGEGRMLTLTEYATAVLSNGLGDYAAALDAARRACAADEMIFTAHSLPELVEAAVHAGDRQLAAAAAERLSERACLSGTDWALGLDARSRALVAPDDVAEPLYEEALERLARCGAALHLARARLVYGEWLRRQGRRSDARAQLRIAHEICVAKGADAFAARAAHELHAAGESTRRSSPELTGALTAQEARIARLAREGQSNADIGAQVFISPRTVEYHLSKIFAKLGIESRRQLENALSDSTAPNGFGD
jgi:DNA-binding CsgD family transcriptional regulator